MALAKDISKQSVILSLSKDQFRLPFFAAVELILRLAFSPELAEGSDDGFLFVNAS